MTNRKTVIEYLRKPELKKFRLPKLGGIRGAYDVLGHICMSLGMKPVRTGYDVHFDGEVDILPIQIAEKIMFHDTVGGVKDTKGFTQIVRKHFKTRGGLEYVSLSDLNDYSDIDMKRIADILEECIEGGDSSPFIKLK